MFGCYISESRIAVSLIFVSGLKDCRVKRRCAVPMPVLQPCAERVQPAIIVHGESMSGSIIVVKEVTVCVEKPLDFQNFLQLGKRPPVLIVTARITPVLNRNVTLLLFFTVSTSYGFESAISSAWSPFTNVVYLEISYSRIKTLWRYNLLFEAFPDQLTKIILSAIVPL